ncbi:UvrD-helicase domain-containing protein [Tepidiforma sp.]|uniref:UvrD-helicase domain-containing protein n=1 Tax=Tepidiforma sp. TaxID=2682230 RepID=UPI002ADE494D|nr:UvrD-helicase domain-containing protein [Tepidiforma sp.]
MTLIDRADRERIRNERHRTLFVEAGAGTGKTTELVGRIVSLVAGGARLRGIAAITFTEKAAAELSDRVRARLEQAAAGLDAYGELDDEARARCREAVAELDSAAFETIHAFARKLLALHPLQAGLPPEFAVLDETEAELEAAERVRRFLDELEQDPELSLPLVAAYGLGLRPRDSRDLALHFAREWDRLAGERFRPPDGEPEWRPPLSRLLEGVREGQNPEFVTGYVEPLEAFAGRLDAAYEAFQRATDERDERLLEFVALAPRTPGMPGTVGKGRPLKAVSDGYREWVGELRTWALGWLLPRLQEFALGYARERREAGRLTFHDLLVLARNLLRDNEDVRRAVHERYPHLLIDEFQDTDPLQVELAALIAGGPQWGGDWRSAEVAGGRLFFVGDPKQSIYRFRRADIAIYETARGSFAAEGVALRTNFRSTRRVVEFVNAACAALFEGNDEAGLQAPWSELEPAPAAVEGVPVRVMGGAIEGSARAVRDLEAETLARAIEDIWRTNAAGTEGGTRYRDIAVLIPRRTGLPAIERALAARGIPYRVESQSLMYQSEELREMTSILAATDDPTDEIALVAALRSPAFACSDAELLAFRRAGGRWNYLMHPPDGAPSRVAGAMERLRAWHEARWWKSPAELVEEVATEARLRQKALVTRRPREAWRRYRLLAEQARALSAAGAVTTLRQFVEWLRRQGEEGVRVNEAIVPEPDDDAVRIMTVHASKGLEFPVVLVAGLGSGGTRRDPMVVWPTAGAGGLPEVRVGPNDRVFKTSGYDAAREVEELREAAEQVRLLYVALTRAQRLLAVSLFRSKQRTGKSLAAKLEEVLEQAAGHYERYEPPEIAVEPEREAPAPGGPVPDRSEWAARRDGLVERLGKARVRPATALAAAASEADAATSEEEGEEALEAEREPWRKGRAGTSIGRAVHAVLQTIDLATGDGLEETAAAQAAAEGVPGEASHVARLARSALDSRPVQEAVRSGRSWREVYVGAEIDGTVVEGFIDLLYERENGELVVVDYKTDTLRSAAEVDAAMARYRLQGAAYAAALQAALGRAVAEVVFVFTEPRAERRVDDLDRAMGEVRELLRRDASTAPAPGQHAGG